MTLGDRTSIRLDAIARNYTGDYFILRAADTQPGILGPASIKRLSEGIELRIPDTFTAPVVITTEVDWLKVTRLIKYSKTSTNRSSVYHYY